MSAPLTAGDRDRQLSSALAALADALVDDHDVVDLLDRLVECSVELLAADAAGLLLGEARHELRVVATSSTHVDAVPLWALEAGDGPGAECYRTAAEVHVPDLTEIALRWPVYAAAVDGCEAFRSVHALPLQMRGHAIGTLVLYRRPSGSMPEVDLALAQALADIATIGILQDRAIRRGALVDEQLQTALHSRVVIEQAGGVVAQRRGLGRDDAFAALRAFARDQELGLAEVAREVVAGRLDPADPQPARPRPALVAEHPGPAAESPAPARTADAAVARGVAGGGSTPDRPDLIGLDEHRALVADLPARLVALVAGGAVPADEAQLMVAHARAALERRAVRE